MMRTRACNVVRVPGNLYTNQSSKEKVVEISTDTPGIRQITNLGFSSGKTEASGTTSGKTVE